MRILVADDDPVFLKLVGNAIRERTSHEVTLADNGAKALELALSQPVPDLLILDWLMPEMSGTQVCRFVRGANLAEQPRIIFVTSRTRREEQLECLAAGADDILTKPFAPDVLISRIQLAFNKDTMSSYPGAGLHEALEKASREGDGELVARSGKTTARVLFTAGQIVWVQLLDKQGSLLDALEKEVGLEPGLSKEILEECRKTGAGLVATLTSWGVVDRNQLREVTQSWLKAKLASLSELESPKFMFLPGKKHYSPELCFQVAELLGDTSQDRSATASVSPLGQPIYSDTRPTLIPPGSWSAAFVSTSIGQLESRRVLERCMSCDGVLGVALLGKITGESFGTIGCNLNPDIVWAQLDALIAIMKSGNVEESVVRTEKHLHLMLLHSALEEKLIYAKVDIESTSYASVRLALQRACAL